jgi:hypothetical protein
MMTISSNRIGMTDSLHQIGIEDRHHLKVIHSGNRGVLQDRPVACAISSLPAPWLGVIPCVALTVTHLDGLFK